MADEEEVQANGSYHCRCDNRGPAPRVILQWTLRGRGVYAEQGREWEVGQGKAFLAMVPGTGHYWQPRGDAEPWVFCWINFSGETAQKSFGDLRADHGPVLPLSESSVPGGLLARLIRESARSVTSDAFQTSIRIYEFLLEWMRYCSEPADAPDDVVKEAVNLCRLRFREPLGVKEIAAEFHLSREHFSRLFSGQAGISPAAFLRGLRVREAVRFLRETKLPLEEVAQRSGFSSSGHMQKVFIRHTGQPPSTWRNLGARRD